METARLTPVLVTIPVFQSVYPRPLKTFLGMAFSTHSEGDKYRFTVHVPERELLHTAMNRTVQMMLASDHEALIVLDDDCFPPLDAISRLLRHYEDGKDIVAGMGYMRGYPHTTTIGRYYPEGATVVTRPDGHCEFIGFEWLDDLQPNSGLVQADFCGFPIGLISRRALEAMESPWFGTIIDGGECTHDVYFGAKAQRAGLEIWVDTAIDCGHLTEAPVIDSGKRAFVRKARTALEKIGAA